MHFISYLLVSIVSFVYTYFVKLIITNGVMQLYFILIPEAILMLILELSLLELACFGIIRLVTIVNIGHPINFNRDTHQPLATDLANQIALHKKSG